MQADEQFSLMKGGPTYKVVHAGVRCLPSVRPDWLITAILLLITFVPLAVLAWRHGTLLPGLVEMPLLADWFVLARFLVALPLLVLAARMADGRVVDAVQQLSSADLIPPDSRDRFDTLIRRGVRLRNAWWPELLCLGLAFLPVMAPDLISRLAATPGVSTWRTAEDGSISPAGVWMVCAAAPVLRFVMLLWLWRFLLWTLMLWRLTMMNLQLRATHPDQACGLGFLGNTQMRFVYMATAGAVILCGSLVNEMIYEGQKPGSFQLVIAGYVIGSMAVLMGPLLLLAPAMVQARRQTLIKYDILGQRLVAAFDSRWQTDADPARTAEMLDNPSPSALTDFSSVHANIMATSIVPVTRWNLAWIILAALLPFAPIGFIAMSLDEMFARIMSALL